MKSKPVFDLVTERLGPLPLVNHFLDRLGLPALLERYVPTDDRRYEISHGKALGVLLRSIVVEREPIYRQQETVQTFAPGSFGMSGLEMEHLTDDRMGKALDHLFDADRSALLTATVVGMAKRFGVRFDEIHNDSTTVRLTGQYRQARGRSIRGRRAPWITYGHSKDHRPDLKQLLFILTTSADGSVPMHFRCEDGNESEATTHIETWDALCQIAGRPDFLYVADSKLCTYDNLDHIETKHGRLVTVMPRNRSEDAYFRKWIQTHEPDWELVWDRPNPRKKKGPRDRWWVFRDLLLSREAWPIIWVKSSLLALRHEAWRRETMAGAMEALGDLKQRLARPKSRIRKSSHLEREIEKIFERFPVKSYVKVQRIQKEEAQMRQQHAGRPNPDTLYVKKVKRRWDVTWETDEAKVAYDKKSDGMYPLLTNDRRLSPAQVLQAHKGQPALEKRFQQCKTIHEIAPVFLQNEGRIEALFFLYFLGLLVSALLERELRAAMKRQSIDELPLYPEERLCKRPTTDQVLRLFGIAQRHLLMDQGKIVQVFPMELTDLQRQILKLLGTPATIYGHN